LSRQSCEVPGKDKKCRLLVATIRHVRERYVESQQRMMRRYLRRQGKMNRLAFVCTAFLLAGCIGGYARTAHTGHLIVTLTDRETGEPITNATVVVRTQTQTEFNPARTLESYFTKTSAMPDTNGVAEVAFGHGLRRRGPSGTSSSFRLPYAQAQPAADGRARRANATFSAICPKVFPGGRIKKTEGVFCPGAQCKFGS